MIGAGRTGVEVVGQIAELAHGVVPGDYHEIDTRKARIVLIEAAPAVLGPFDEKLQRYTQTRLERMGVEVRCGTTANRDGRRQHHGPRQRRRGAHSRPEEGMGCRGESITAGRLLARATGADTERAGRIAVAPDCTLPGHPEVFAIGDMVSLNGLPGVAQPAIQEGKYVGKGDSSASGW